MLLSPYRLEAARPLLKLGKEAWEAKFYVAWYLLNIWYLFPGSFAGFWTLLTDYPFAPFLPQDLRLTCWLAGATASQCLVILLIWKGFLRSRKELPPPWNELDVDYVFKACCFFPATPIRGIHFICKRFGSDRRRAIRQTPWHFRHSISLAYGAIMLFCWFKVSGLDALVHATACAILIETIGLFIAQVEAAFGKHRSAALPKLDYRHKPRFAIAIVTATVAYFSLAASVAIVPLAAAFALFAAPIVAVQVLVSYMLHGHQPDFLNKGGLIFGSYNMDFCLTCESTVLARDDSDRHRRIAHHHNIDSLKLSAQNGCRICAAVWQACASIPKDVFAVVLYWKPATTYRTSFKALSGFCIEVNGVAIEFDARARLVPDRWSRDMLDIRQRLNLVDMSEHTGSEQSLNQARQWLQNCMIHHGVCCADQDETFRPSRLLCVDNDSICVQNTNQMRGRIRYLTLSHRWGKESAMPLRLLTTNHDCFLEGIAWKELPKTFQDAIHITRCLGHSYIWIDSLCIVQDSEVDWNHEARLMGKVYQNSTCNIAASNAADSTHGCLYPRDARALQPTVLDGAEGDERYLINGTDVFGNHLLYTRAWVLQEALLARRTLDCSCGQLFWRCSEMRASEVFPGGLPTNIYDDDHPASKLKAISAEQDQVIMNANVLTLKLRSKMHELTRGPGKTSLEQNTDSPFAVWRFLVGDYTNLNLTKASDRIFAFAGIVDVFRPFFGEYNYGLWTIFMPAGLLWHRSSRVQEPERWRAPSWSWLSVEGAVTLWSCDFKYGRDILLTKFVSVSGETESLKLTFSAILLKARLNRDDICEIEGNKEWFGFGSVTLDLPDAADVEEDVYLMCVLIHRERDEVILVGLVLGPESRGTHKRLGYFQDSRRKILPFVKNAWRRRIVLV